MITGGKLKPKIWVLLYLFIIVTFTAIRNVLSESQTCGTLFSKEYFHGDEFILHDRDQSVNTYKDYRSLLSGWGNTTSIKVEENCRIKICDGTYFEGKCYGLPGGLHFTKNSISDIRSVSCDCSNVCECGKVSIPKNPMVCGRAYMNNTCNKCDSDYLPFMDSEFHWNVPEWPKDSVDTILLRKGCTLTTYSGVNGIGTKKVLRSPVIKGFTEKIGSYKCSCNGPRYFPSSINFQPTPKLLDFPSDKYLLDNMFSNISLSLHPGLKAARKSLEAGRSPSLVFIIALGIMTPSWIGLHGCPVAMEKIGECSIKINVNEIGLRETELRIIYTPMGSDEDHLNDDARLLATLKSHLDTDPQLKNAIPNAVIVNPLNDTTFLDRHSKFQRKLAAVSALRNRIIDENYSNLIFLFDAGNNTRNPEIQLGKIEENIEKSWNFPKPIVILTKEARHIAESIRFNGRWETKSGEYFFHNLNKKLMVACNKSGDSLGHAVLKESLPFEEKDWIFGNRQLLDLLPVNDTKVTQFRELFFMVSQHNRTLELQLARISVVLGKLNPKMEISNQPVELGESDMKQAIWKIAQEFMKHTKLSFKVITRLFKLQLCWFQV